MTIVCSSGATHGSRLLGKYDHESFGVGLSRTGTPSLTCALAESWTSYRPLPAQPRGDRSGRCGDRHDGCRMVRRSRRRLSWLEIRFSRSGTCRNGSTRCEAFGGQAGHLFDAFTDRNSRQLYGCEDFDLLRGLRGCVRQSPAGCSGSLPWPRPRLARDGHLRGRLRTQPSPLRFWTPLRAVSAPKCEGRAGPRLDHSVRRAAAWRIGIGCGHGGGECDDNLSCSSSVPPASRIGSSRAAGGFGMDGYEKPR